MEAARAARAEFPMWGKAKIAAPLRREDWAVSESTAGRVPEALVERGEERRINPKHREKECDILARPNAAAGPEDMELPGLRLHRLTGVLAGFRAVVVNANWRAIFR